MQHQNRTEQLSDHHLNSSRRMKAKAGTMAEVHHPCVQVDTLYCSRHRDQKPPSSHLPSRRACQHDSMNAQARNFKRPAPWLFSLKRRGSCSSASGPGQRAPSCRPIAAQPGGFARAGPTMNGYLVASVACSPGIMCPACWACVSVRAFNTHTRACELASNIMH